MEKIFQNKTRKAKMEDLESILEIQDSHNISSKSAKDRAREGFLVYIMPREEVQSLITDPLKDLYVYTSNNGIEGYLANYDNRTSYSQECFKTAELSLEGKEIITSKNYVHLRQVAKKQDASSRVPYYLEKNFESEMKQRGYEYSVGEIALDPLNVKSYDFHISMGYKQIGKVYDSIKDITWGIFAKKLN